MIRLVAQICKEVNGENERQGYYCSDYSVYQQ